MLPCLPEELLQEVAKHLEDVGVLSMVLNRPGVLKGSYVAKHVNVLKWVRDEYGLRESIMHHAAAAGNIYVLKFCFEEGIFFPGDAMPTAVYHGQIALMDWIDKVTRGSWEDDLSATAVKGGHLDSVKWLRSRRRFTQPFGGSEYCEIAAEHGNVAMLDYLYTMGGSALDKYVAAAAAREGHANIFEFAGGLILSMCGDEELEIALIHKQYHISEMILNIHTNHKHIFTDLYRRLGGLGNVEALAKLVEYHIPYTNEEISHYISYGDPSGFLQSLLI